MNPIDPLQLQRLADGQLDLPAIKQLLADAQSNPENWPAIAKTMIEQQLWERSFQGDANALQDLTETGSTTASTVQSDTVQSDTVQLDKSNPSFPSSKSPARPRNWLAIVAGLMVAGLTGYLAGGVNRDLGPADTNIASSSVDSVDAEQLATTGYQPDYHLEIPANSQWAKSSELSPTGRVPLYSVNDKEQFKQFRQHQQDAEKFDPEVLRRLAAAGYQIKNDVELISGDLNDREKYIVPVRTIRLIPSQ